MRGKQYVKKGVWYIGGKKRKQKGGAFPLGLLASIGAPILGEIAKPILGKILVGGENLNVEEEDEDYETKNRVIKKINSKSCYVTKLEQLSHWDMRGLAKNNNLLTSR